LICWNDRERAFTARYGLTVGNWRILTFQSALQGLPTDGITYASWHCLHCQRPRCADVTTDTSAWRDGHCPSRYDNGTANVLWRLSGRKRK
jgi:Fe-S-cluster-containing dehydrogenase component